MSRFAQLEPCKWYALVGVTAIAYRINATYGHAGTVRLYQAPHRIKPRVRVLL